MKIVTTAFIALISLGLAGSAHAGYTGGGYTGGGYKGGGYAKKKSSGNAPKKKVTTSKRSIKKPMKLKA